MERTNEGHFGQPNEFQYFRERLFRGYSQQRQKRRVIKLQPASSNCWMNRKMTKISNCVGKFNRAAKFGSGGDFGKSHDPNMWDGPWGKQ